MSFKEDFFSEFYYPEEIERDEDVFLSETSAEGDLAISRALPT